MTTVAIYSQAGAARLAGSFLTNMAGRRSANHTQEIWEEEYVPFSVIEERMGEYVHTNSDLVDTNVDGTPLIDRLRKAVDSPYTDDESLLRAIGFYPTGEFSHFTNKGVPNVVGPGMGTVHKPVQIPEFLDWVKSLCGETIMAAGTMRNGRSVYAVAKSPAENLPTLPGVEHGLVTFVDSRDGSTPSIIIPTTFIPRCANVFPSLRGGLSRNKHTSTTVDRTNNDVADMIMDHSVYTESADILGKMMDCKVSFADFVNEILPEGDTDKGETRRMGVRDELWSCRDRFVDVSQKNTLFGAFQAAESYDRWENVGDKVNPFDRQFDTFVKSSKAKSNVTVGASVSTAAREYVMKRLGKVAL